MPKHMSKHIKVLNKIPESCGVFVGIVFGMLIWGIIFFIWYYIF